jgi:peptidoglycan/LPS O-acetylase OafA/YrhL
LFDSQGIELGVMNTTQLRRVLLRTAIGFLCLTAVTAAMSVMLGDFGPLHIKVILTTLILTVACLLGMACAAYLEIRGKGVVGWSGVGMAVIAAVLLITGVWIEENDHGYWQVALTAACFVGAISHGCLISLPSLGKGRLWVQRIGVLSLATLALLIELFLWEVADSEGFFRLLAVNAIVVALVSTVVPILARVRSAGTERHDERLQLVRQAGDVYADAEGALYRVIPEVRWPKEES